MSKLRFFLAPLCVLLCLATTASADDPHLKHDRQQHNLAAPEGVSVGDTKFMHGDFHDSYQQLLVEINGDEELPPGLGDKGSHPELKGAYQKLYAGTKCSCDYGSCRPTVFRIQAQGTTLEGNSGYEALIDGKWYPVPQESLHQENDLSADLWEELMGNLPSEVNGHICGYPSPNYPNGMRIECAIPADTLG